MRPESKIDVGFAVAVGAADDFGFTVESGIGPDPGSRGLVVATAVGLAEPVAEAGVGAADDAIGSAEEEEPTSAGADDEEDCVTAATVGDGVLVTPAEAIVVGASVGANVAVGAASATRLSPGLLVFQAAKPATPTATITAAVSPTTRPPEDFRLRASVALLARAA